MKILCLNPPFKTEYGRFSRTSRSPAVTKSGTIYYPIWLCYVAGVLDTSTPSIYNDVKTGADIKKILPDCFIVFMGTHPTALLGETLRLSNGELTGVKERGKGPGVR